MLVVSRLPFVRYCSEGWHLRSDMRSPVLYHPVGPEVLTSSQVHGNIITKHPYFLASPISLKSQEAHRVSLSMSLCASVLCHGLYPMEGYGTSWVGI